jgi:hypothetical protein
MIKLGMQGVSIVLASGDSGVAARSTDDNNSDGCLGTGEVSTQISQLHAHISLPWEQRTSLRAQM